MQSRIGRKPVILLRHPEHELETFPQLLWRLTERPFEGGESRDAGVQRLFILLKCLVGRVNVRKIPGIFPGDLQTVPFLAERITPGRDESHYASYREHG